MIENQKEGCGYKRRREKLHRLAGMKQIAQVLWREEYDKLELPVCHLLFSVEHFPGLYQLFRKQVRDVNILNQ